MKFKKIILILLSLIVVISPNYSFADEITVSNNGEGSTNSVNIDSSNSTQVEQTNTSEINNNVDVNANTGNNNASENNGEETNITTGDVSASSEIVNTDINESFVETGCCQNELAMNISGNGSDSVSSIDYSTNNTTNVLINNNAIVHNSVNGKANTGENSANQNNGNVSIQTGNIYATDVIKNKLINAYAVEALNGNGGSVYISIKDNAANSDNSIKFSADSDINITIDNSANIVNDSDWDLNTGRNSANQNNGDVKITTGDIYFAASIENGPVNYGFVDVDCCEEDEDEDGGNPPDGTPPVSNPPTTNGNGNNGPSNGGGNGGAGGAGVTQTVLPVTGSSSLLFLAIGNVVMLFLGWYLRLRSGRSPNYLFAR